MKIVKFKDCDVVYDENQPEYLLLPVHKTDEGRVTSCWKLSFLERLCVALTGRLFLQVLTPNEPSQPLKMSIKNPLKTFFVM